MTTTSPKMSFFGPYLTPRAKLKITNLFAHLQDMSNHILEYHLAMTSDVDRVQMTRNSSDGQTNGRGNNNMLEFSLESTGIINIFTMITLTNVLT